MNNISPSLKFDGPLITPNAGAEVDGGQLLNDLEAYYQKYARMPEWAYPIMATWVVHCHAFMAFTRTPYINLSSPAPECGKTTVLEITELVVPNPWLTMSISNAVLARKIHGDNPKPTLLLDEVDQILAGDKDLRSAVMETINGGYKKSGKRTILVPKKGGDWQPVNLSTFCPKIFSGIADLPPTTKSRCIPIAMERLGRNERVSDIDEYIIDPEANAIFVRAHDWSRAHLKQLCDARPAAPPELGHRQREVCRPLLAIADAAGGEWPQRLRSALIKCFSSLAAEPPADLKILALTHVREVLAMHAEDVRDGDVPSADLCSWLAEIEDGPWVAWGKSGKPITQNQLARQLRGFAMPGRVRIGGRTCRGYSIRSLETAFDRYLPLPPDSKCQTATRDDGKELSEDFKVPQNGICGGSKNDVSRSTSTDVALWHCEDGGTGGSERETGNGNSLPSCVKCGSYALYRGKDGSQSCQSCGAI